MSLPGFKNDKVIHLGSVEFFSFMNRSLKEDGIVANFSAGDIDQEYKYRPGIEASSTYSDVLYLKPLFKDMHEGGFQSYAKYFALYQDKYRRNSYFPGDTMYLFQKKNIDRQLDFDSSDYLKKVEPYFNKLAWRDFDHLNLENTRASHVFSPNYEIMTLF